MKQFSLAIIWPGYRSNNRYFWQLLINDSVLSPFVLWIRNFRSDDPPPLDLLNGLNWSVVGADNIRVSGYNIKTFFKMVISIWRVIKNCEYVITSTQAPIHSKVAFCIAKIQRKPIFIVIQQWRDLSSGNFIFKIYKNIDIVMMRHCNKLFPHGTNQFNFALKKGVKYDKIKVLPFLSEDLSYKPCKRKEKIDELGLKGKKVVLYFGRITPQKGLKDLLYSFLRVCNYIENVVLLVCGGSDINFDDYCKAKPYESECQSLAEEILTDKVIFVGPIMPSEKQDYFSIADIFIHPHTNIGDLNDGWGLVLNEAASMGLPIICTDRVGGAPDLIINGKSGYIVSAGDIEEMSNKIIDLLKDDNKRSAFGIASRKIFENYHSTEEISKVIIEAIDESKS